MATKGYPGLVVVPPSDRWRIRRRLVSWAFFIIAVAWIASTSRIWVPSLDNNGDCQTDIGQGTFANFPEECGQPDLFLTETESQIVDSTLAKASQGGKLAGSHKPKPIPITGQLVKQQGTDQKSMTKPPGPALRSLDRAKSPPSRNGSVASVATGKPASNSIPDTRLAEQGDAFAQYRLGRFYAQLGGSHAPESVNWYVKASDGLRRLAEDGDGEAMYVLGVMYAFGRGVAKDREQARLWLAQAVDQQVPAAHVVLARLDGHRSADSR
jgi:uncharacterized protein